MQEYIDFVSRHPLLIIGFVAVLAFTLKLELGRLTSKCKRLGVSAAVLLLNKDNTVVLDVREDKEINQGVIKGARHIPLAQLAEKIPELSKNKQNPILVYCKSGSRSGHACQLLTKAGFEDVSNLSGGIMAWQTANLPLAKR
jgi:rhodanese-related sulfurtransferase